MTMWRRVQVLLAIGAGLMAFAWIGYGFAVGFGWEPPEAWNTTALGLTTYAVFAVCLVGIPVVAAVRLEED